MTLWKKSDTCYNEERIQFIHKPNHTRRKGRRYREKDWWSNPQTIPTNTQEDPIDHSINHSQEERITKGSYEKDERRKWHEYYHSQYKELTLFNKITNLSYSNNKQEENQWWRKSLEQNKKTGINHIWSVSRSTHY